MTHFSHSNVVESVGAVEDDALNCNRLCQIFGRLRLSSTSRTFRSAVQVEMEGAHQRSIASVS